MANLANRFGLGALAAALIAATTLVGGIWISPQPFLIWNASKSVPIGWYWVAHRQPKLHEIALVKLQDWPELYADARGYLPHNVWLLKPVAAEFPGVVCRFGRYVFVDGIPVARARKLDHANRILPRWKGCRVLKSDELFLVARPADSFDSRYFGPVKLSQVAGVVHRLHLPLD